MITDEDKMTYLDVVFDGPPSHESGRFVEVEAPDGRSVCAGEWIDRGDGMWALRIGIGYSKQQVLHEAIAAITHDREERQPLRAWDGMKRAEQVLADMLSDPNSATEAALSQKGPST